MNPADLFRHETEALHLVADEVLFREGDAGDVMYVVLEGTVEILTQEHLLESAEPGALIGEMAMIDAEPRAATARARTDCRLARVDARRFHFLIQQNPFFATHVMRELVRRLRRTNALFLRAEG